MIRIVTSDYDVLVDFLSNYFGSRSDFDKDIKFLKKKFLYAYDCSKMSVDVRKKFNMNAEIPENVKVDFIDDASVRKIYLCWEDRRGGRIDIIKFFEKLGMRYFIHSKKLGLHVTYLKDAMTKENEKKLAYKLSKLIEIDFSFFCFEDEC